MEDGCILKKRDEHRGKGLSGLKGAQGMGAEARGHTQECEDFPDTGTTRRGLKTRVRTCRDIQGHRTVRSRMLFPTQEAKKTSRLTQLPAYVKEAGKAAERGGAPNYSRSPPPGYCPHLGTQT